MPYSITLPDGSSVDNIPDELDPKEAARRIAAAHPELMGQIPGGGAGPKGGFMPAMKASWEDLKGGLAAVAGKTGWMTPEEAEAQQARNKAEGERVFKPTDKGWFDAPGTKIAELGGQSLPWMVAPIAVGSAAALGGVPAAVGIGLAGLTSAAQFTGSNLQRQQGTGKRLADTDFGAAALASVPQAVLDMVGFKMIPGIRQIFAAAGKELTPKMAAEIAKKGMGSVAADYVKATGKAMTAEGLTEAGQQVFERLQAGLELNDPQARKEYFDNFVGGAVLGGALAPVGRFRERGQEQMQQAQIEQAEQAKADAAAQAQKDQEKQQLEAQRQDPAYAQQVAEDYKATEEQYRAMKPAKLGANPTEADRIAHKEANRAAEDFRKETLLPKAEEFNLVRPALQAQQAEAFKAAGAQADAAAYRQNANKAEDSGETTGAGDAVLQQMIADRTAAYQERNAAVEAAKKAVAAGDIQAAKQAQDAAAAANQRGSAIDKQIGGRSGNNTTIAPADVTGQLTRLQKQYGVALQSGKVQQADALLAQIGKLTEQAKAQQALLQQSPNVQTQMVEDQETQGQDGPLTNTPTPPVTPQAPFRPQATPMLDQTINMRGETAPGRPRETYRKPGPDAQRQITEQNTAPETDATQQQPLFEELPTPVAQGADKTTQLLTQIQQLQARPNMPANTKASLDNLSNVLQNPNLATSPARERIVADIAEQVYRVANIGEGAAPQINTREGVRGELTNKQQQLNALREKLAGQKSARAKDAALLRRSDQYQPQDTPQATQQQIDALQAEMQQLAQQLRQTTSTQTVPVEQRAVKPVYIPQGEKGLTKKQQASPEPTQADIAGQTPKTSRTFSPGYTGVGEVGYVNQEPRTEQTVSPTRTAASTQTTDTTLAPSGSKMPTTSTSAKVETRAAPKATGSVGSGLTLARDIDEQALELSPADQQTFDFWDTVYGVGTPAYEKVRQAEALVTRIDAELDAAEKLRTEKNRTHNEAIKKEKDRQGALRGEPGVDLQPLDDSSIIDDATKEARAKADAAYEAARADEQAAQDAYDKAMADLTKRAGQAQEDSIVSYLTKPRDAVEQQVNEAAGALIDVLGRKRNLTSDVETARDSVASLLGTESLTPADVKVYLKNKPAFEQAVGPEMADTFETVVRLKAALDTDQRLSDVKAEYEQEQAKLEKAKDRVAEAGAARPPRRTLLQATKQALDASTTTVAEITKRAESARKQLESARALRREVIAAADDMRTGKVSKLQEQQELLRADIANLSDQLDAIAQTVDSVNSAVDTDVELLLKYPGAMRALEDRFDFSSAVLSGLETEGVSSPKLETQLAGMSLATQRAEQVKHDRRMQTLTREQSAWQRVLDSDTASDVAKGKAKRALREVNSEIAALETDYKQRTLDADEATLANSAGMRNARAADAAIRQQRDRLNTAYESLVSQVRAAQSMLVPPNKENERTADTAGIPAAKRPATVPDNTDAKRKRGLLMLLSTIDAQEQEKLDAAIDKAGENVAAERRAFDRTEGAALPESYFQAADAYDRAVAAKRSYMEDRRKLEVRQLELAKDIMALPKEEYQALVQSEQDGTPLDQPSAGLTAVAKQLEQRPMLRPEPTRAETAEEVALQAFKDRLSTVTNAGGLRKERGALESARDDLIERAEAGEHGGDVVPLPTRMLSSSLVPRQEARRTLLLAKARPISAKIKAINDRLEQIREGGTTTQPTERELQGNVFEVFAAEQAKSRNQRQGAVVRKAVVAGDQRSGSKESRAGLNKTGTRNKVQETSAPRSPTAKQAMREGNAIAKKLRAESALDDIYADETYDSNTGPVYRTATTAGAGMKSAEVTRLANRVMEGWTNTPPVDVVETEADLPQRLQDQAAKDKMTGKIPGLFDPDTGKVYLVAENLHTGQDVVMTIAHEVAGHYGLRSMMGDQYAPTMNRLYNGNSDIKAKADAKMQVSPDLSREVAVEEALAEMAEQGNVGALKQIYHAIKAWIAQKLGFKGVTDKEVRQIVANARQHVMEGTPGGKPPSGPKGTVYRSGQNTLADKVIARKTSFKERIGDNLALAAEMMGVDMRAPLERVLRMGNSKTAQQAMYLVRKNDARMNQVFAVLQNGALNLKTDAKGNYVVEAGGGPAVGDVFKAIQAMPGTNADAKMRDAQMYLIAKRAQTVGVNKFMRGKFTQQEISDELARLTADPKQKAALERVAALYNEYNKGLINFLVQSGYMEKSHAAKLLQSGNYVPYYRVADNGKATLEIDNDTMIVLGDIRNQPYLKELKGDDEMMLPLNESIVRNTMLLTDMGMRNLTTKNVAYALQELGAGKGTPGRNGRATNVMDIVKGEGPADARTLRFKIDGKDFFTLIDTKGTAAEGIPAEMLAKSMEGTHLVMPAFLKAAGWFGDVLRSGVTRNPIYVARQLFRDPIAASFTGGLDRGPLMAIGKSVAEFARASAGRSPGADILIRKGVTQSQIFTGDPDDLAKMALQLAGNDNTALQKLFAMADRAAMRADAATRVQLYNDVLAKTGSEMEAELAAMEMMNFHKRGLAPTVQYASRMIPFFNAQIQGLNVLHKAMTGKMTAQEAMGIKQKFFDRAMLLAAGTLVYAMAMEDDDTYKNARPSERYNYWFVPLSRGPKPEDNVTLKLPIPFEIGVLFKAIPEALIDLMRGNFGAKEWEASRNLVLNQIPGASSYGLPQMVRPLIEVGTNHNFFTGREVEGTGMRNVDPQERFTARTTELAKRLSEMAQMSPVDALKLSPLQIEHLVRGYMGQLPIAVAAATNELFGNPAAGQPAGKLNEAPLVGGLFQDVNGGGAADALYAKIRAADQAKATFEKLKKEGRQQDAILYRDDVLNILYSPMLQQAENGLHKLAQDEKKIRQAPVTALSAERKREMLDSIAAQRTALSNRYLSAVGMVAR